MQKFMIEGISSQSRSQIDRQIAESWGGPYIVTKGILHDTRNHPGFAALENGEVVIGYILYNIAGDGCEITVLESMCAGRGIGSALINEVICAAQKKKCRRLWLITTNDNTRALRFYQRFGFTLKAVHINAMDAARRLKPQIPLTGEDDIPIQHEFEFEMPL